MRLRELWRTTTFRLTVLHGLVFALGAALLLGVVYAQSDKYLTRRVDGIVRTEADALVTSPPWDLNRRIDEALALNGARTNVYAVFSARGQRVAGNLQTLPEGLRAGGPPLEIAGPRGFQTRLRVIARAMPSARCW